MKDFSLCHHQSCKPNDSACQQLTPTAKLWNILALLTEEKILMKRPGFSDRSQKSSYRLKNKTKQNPKPKSNCLWFPGSSKELQNSCSSFELSLKIVSWFCSISSWNSCARDTFFLLHHVESSFPGQGSNPCALQSKCGISTTGPPGKAPEIHFLCAFIEDFLEVTDGWKWCVCSICKKTYL